VTALRGKVLSLLAMVFFSFIPSAYALIDQPLPGQSNWSYGSSAAGHLQNSFSVLVWNIQKAAGKEKFQKDFSSLLPQSDVALLQEAIINPYTLTIMNKSWAWHLGISFFMEEIIPTGVMTGSRVNSWNWDVIRSKGTEPFLDSNKMIVWNQIPAVRHKNGILFVNIHGLNFVSDQVNMNHIDQSFELIRRFTGPIVFAGDFNTWTSDRRRHLEEGIARLGLKEVTWPAGKGPNPAFDHAFYRGLKVEHAQFFGKVKSSDHSPFLIRFSQ